MRLVPHCDGRRVDEAIEAQKAPLDHLNDTAENKGGTLPIEWNISKLRILAG